MSDIKTFHLGDVLSMVTGKCCKAPFCGQDVAEQVLGRSIWTHELIRASNEIRNAIVAQYPAMADCNADGVVNEETAAAYVKQEAARLGLNARAVPLRRGNTKRTESPLDTLTAMMPDADVLVVNVNASKED